ncbi:MAG: CPBP family intramembrane glutamic endopeptidase [Gemmatimonadota bacterium]
MRIVAVGHEPLPPKAWPAIRLFLWYFGAQLIAGVVVALILIVSVGLGGGDIRTSVAPVLAEYLVPITVLTLLASAWILSHKARHALPAAAWPKVLASLGWRPALRSEMSLGILLGVAFGAAYLFSLTQLFPPGSHQSFGGMATAVSRSPVSSHLLFAIAAVLLVPPVEEFLFRGLLLAGFGYSWGAVPAMVGVTALFVAGHAFETHSYWPALLSITVVACVALTLRLRTNSLWPGIRLQASYNAVLMTALFFHTA